MRDKQIVDKLYEIRDEVDKAVFKLTHLKDTSVFDKKFNRAITKLNEAYSELTSQIIILTK